MSQATLSAPRYRHESWIRNTWPRPGIVANSAEGMGQLGRFVCHEDSWRYEDFRFGVDSAGVDDPLEALDSILQNLKLKSGYAEAGAIGYVGYEWGCRIRGAESHLSNDHSWQLPDAQFLVFERLTHPEPRCPDLKSFAKRSFNRLDLDTMVRSDSVQPCISKSRYLADIWQIKEHIEAGDIYQANYTQAFDIKTDCASSENSVHVSSRLHAPYSAYLKFDESSIVNPDNSVFRFPAMAVISSSPERFCRVRDGLIDSRPIKGTIGRSGDAKLDLELRRQLITSKKDRAELLMITDLVRNDLGQVADIGSVKTQTLVRIRPTPSVWHLESSVSGRLASNRSWVDAMKALLPAGSISGTPKRRAIEILDSLEPQRRGPYCGAIGWVDAQGDADFAVGIRTCVQVGDTIRIHGGGGIVADSDPEAEYYESLVKIAPLLEILTESRQAWYERELLATRGSGG